MKTLKILLGLVGAVIVARMCNAANPSFEDFNTNHFSTTGYEVSLSPDFLSSISAATNPPVWINSGGQIYPADNKPVGIFYDMDTTLSSILYSARLFSSTNSEVSSTASLIANRSGGINGPQYYPSVSLDAQYGINTAAVSLTAYARSNSALASLTAYTNGEVFFKLDYTGLTLPMLANAGMLATDASGRFYPTNEMNGVTNINVENINTTNINTTVVNAVSNFSQTITVSGKATLQVVNMLSGAATNGFFVFTNSWSGSPTGTVDMSFQDQGYRTFTPMAITGLINRSNLVSETVVLTLTNGATTNVLLTLDGGIRIPQRTNQLTLSNSSLATLSLRYHPTFGTNGVWVQF